MSSLTSLHVNIRSASDTCYNTIVSNNRSTLTYLGLSASASPKTLAMAHTEMPRLRHLALDASFAACASRLLTAHADQLSYLHISSPVPSHVLALARFPRVTDLRLRFAPVDIDLPSHFPALARLHLDLSGDQSDHQALLFGLAPYLASLRCDRPYHVDFCAALRSLHCPELIAVPLLTQLTSLACGHLVKVDWQQATALRSLYFTAVPWDPPLSLPINLSVFHMCWHEISLTDFGVIVAAMERCTALTMLGLWTGRPLASTVYSALNAFLRGAFRRGLLRFISYSVLTQFRNDYVSLAKELRSDPALRWLAVSEVLVADRPVFDLC